VRLRHRAESVAVGALSGAARTLSLPAARGFGAALGSLVGSLGVRRRVARENLARAFPEQTGEERERILAEHYRELGRVFLEYTQLDRLARADAGGVVGEIRGREHLQAALDSGRGAILMTGHFSNFELMAARLAHLHPVDVLVRSQRNTDVDERIARLRTAAGLGTLRADTEVRRALEALKAGRWLALVADQDAGRNAAFVPFFGRPASTTLGPARMALAMKVPIVMGFVTRRSDGRLDLEVDPPMWGDASLGKAAALDLTRRHVERLEHWVRRYPAMWFWLHRRWKTRAPGEKPNSSGGA
jgi:KDO2-lipid IV(A) lauroyltransferase